MNMFLHEVKIYLTSCSLCRKKKLFEVNEPYLKPASQRPKLLCLYAKWPNSTSCSVRRKNGIFEGNQPYLTNPTGTQHKLNTQIYERTRYIKQRLCEVYMTSAEANKNAKTPNTTKQENNVMVI